MYRAVDNFDYALGNKFSTYAMSSITRAIIRDMDQYQNWRIGRYVKPQGIDNIATPKSERFVQEQEYPALQRSVQDLLMKVDRRSRLLLAARYGLDGGDGVTLTELGEEMGISKQRTRELEKRALTRLSRELNPLDDLI